ncbi:hydroxymethylbilane synthase [Sulfolobales archaeon HS-7]|nr:hydroxymethylbilane synthase [Sulfolobales archaeon HS-7]
MKIRVAARGSLLSRIQAEKVIHKLNEYGLQTELIEVRTRGDRNQDAPLYTLGKGVFEKEVNLAVLQGIADIAVHSMKDLPTDLVDGLSIAAVLDRDPPFDAIVGKSLLSLDQGDVVGTSSIRRKNMILAYNNQLQIKEIRGNVDTRIRKLKEGDYDALILAEAGLRRIGENGFERIDPKIVTPEANQGIIAIITTENSKVREYVKELNNEDVMIEAIAERAVVNKLKGGCNVPLGVLFKKEDGKLFGIAGYASDFKKVTVDITWKSTEPEEAGSRLGKILVEAMKNEGIVLKT